jgi:fatty acid-binding protein DegV
MQWIYVFHECIELEESFAHQIYIKNKDFTSSQIAHVEVKACFRQMLSQEYTH